MSDSRPAPPRRDDRRSAARAAGVAVLGVLALGVTANAPAPERRAPVTNFGGTDAPRQLPARVPGSILERSATTPSR